MVFSKKMKTNKLERAILTKRFRQRIIGCLKVSKKAGHNDDPLLCGPDGYFRRSCLPATSVFRFSRPLNAMYDRPNHDPCMGQQRRYKAEVGAHHLKTVFEALAVALFGYAAHEIVGRDEAGIHS